MSSFALCVERQIQQLLDYKAVQFQVKNKKSSCRPSLGSDGPIDRVQVVISYCNVLITCMFLFHRQRLSQFRGRDLLPWFQRLTWFRLWAGRRELCFTWKSCLDCEVGSEEQLMSVGFNAIPFTRISGAYLTNWHAMVITNWTLSLGFSSQKSSCCTAWEIAIWSPNHSSWLGMQMIWGLLAAYQLNRVLNYYIWIV